jgi:uncharacterized lipoprotein YddW (UPF0748 family)
MTKKEIRGVWITNTDSQALHSQKNIAEAMEFLAETGFNVVFPVVWNKAKTLYSSKTMKETFGVEIDPLFSGRDPLAELVNEAHRFGLKVMPWFEYGFASSYNLNGGMLLARKPEWAAKDSQGKLLKKNGFEWLNAFDPQVQDFLLNLALEVAKNYDVDGIQGDDRFPALPSEGGYDELTRKRYRQAFNQNPPDNPKDKQWLQWRADILTDFLARLYKQVKGINPKILVSVAPNIYDWALKEYLQDSPAWLEKGLLDIIHPQIYRRDFLSYKLVIDKLVREQFTAKTLPRLAPGILVKVGDYRISAELLLKKIEYNRSCGIDGEVLFFYEGLRLNNNELAKALRNGPYANYADFPNLQDLPTTDILHRGSLWSYLKRIFWVNG